MDEKTALSSRLAPRSLPWMAALASLVLYWITVCRWMNPLNLEPIGQLAGWLWQLPYHSPLQFLIALPLRLLPGSIYPLAANLLAGVFGAATLGLLTRSIQLLPYDRTHEGRIRGHADEPSLHIRFSWVPPVFAAALLGLQLTFWEHATAMTGEMLNLLVFAYCIRCLLEYRLDVREGWLWKMAFVYGLGVTNNWAMIGFAPLFLIAMIWIRGFSFFNFGFLLRLVGFGALGLLLYVVMPLWVVMTNRVDSSFFDSLYAVLISQKTILLGMPRVKALVLSLICIVPFIAMGVRWAGTRGSSIERGIATGTVYLLKFAWLAGCVVIMFNVPFSPREMVQNDVGLGMLTFYYLAAIVAGYFLGLFLLVFGTAPDRHHGPEGPFPPALGKLLHWVLLVTALAVPVYLGTQSYPKAKDTGALSVVAEELLRPVPQQPSILVADNMTYLWLVEAQRRRMSNPPEHLLINTQDARRKDYQIYLEKRYLGVWPDLTKFTRAESEILLQFLNLLAEKGKAGRAFYLHHSFGMFFEAVQLRPRGLINQIEGFGDSIAWPAALSAEEIQRNLELWKQAEASFSTVVEKNEGGYLAWISSRAANHTGVEMQRAGRLDEARHLFDLALKWSPKNPSAIENVKVNEQLRGHKKLSLEADKMTALLRAPRTTMDLINAFGPSEDPSALLVFGRNCLESPEELNRQAANTFHRLLELVPGEFIPTSLQASALLKWNRPDEALKMVKQLRELHARQPLAATEFADMVGLESLARSRMGDADGALRLVQEARKSQPENIRVLDNLANLLINRGNLDEAGKVVAEWNRLKPEDPLGFFRRAQIHMLLGQYQPAAEGFGAVIKKEPSNRVALLNRAICNLVLKNFDDSRRDYLRLAEEFPDRPEVQFGLGEIAAQKKKTAEALEHFQRYLEVAPRNSGEYTNVLKRVEALKGKNL